MKAALEIIEMLGDLAIFLGAILTMAWAVCNREWTLFFAATAACGAMEYHIDKRIEEE